METTLIFELSTESCGGLYTVGSTGIVSKQVSEAMYEAYGILWRVVADHNRMESEMKRLNGSVSRQNTGITEKLVTRITE
jgi:hypothetical protein